MILIAVLFLISGVSARHTMCPQPNGKFPIENTLCKSYYECENWKVTKERTCPPRQNFNPVLQKCDYEELYYCAEVGLQKYKRCKKAAGKFPKENTFCKTFYECEKWKVVSEFTCPPGQNFNPAKQWCDWEEIYPCLEDKPKECPQPTGLYPKPGSRCKNFYQCINWKPYELQCPKDLNFNPVRGQCEWPELYPCDELGERTTQTKAPQQTSPAEEMSRHTNAEETTLTTGDYISFSHETKTETGKIFITENLSSTDERGISDSTGTKQATETAEDSTDSVTKEVSQNTETEEIASPTESGTSTETERATTTNREYTTIPTEEVTDTRDIVSTTRNYTPFVTTHISPGRESEETTHESQDNSLITRQTSDSDTTAATEEMSTSTEKQETTELDKTHPTEQTSDKEYERTSLLTTFTRPETTSTTSVKTSTSTYAKTSVATPSPDEVVCPRANGIFPHPTNLHKFLSCLDFVPTEMDCPGNLIYEPTLEACIFDTRRWM